MLRIIRELVKLSMLVIFWGFPLVLVKWSDNYYFLWFYALSFIASSGMFSHYEDLAKIEAINQIEYDEEENNE